MLDQLEQPEIRQFLTLVRAGADPQDVATYLGLTVADMVGLVDEVEQAQAELAVYAAGILRQAMDANPSVARYILDRQAGRNEIERLRQITELT